ncbi:PepSY-associated TM helix domain-containing protein [Carboxylicivirga mesophila]|uniref:PepSY-associated TM helix domain-containing protein n=1 Tax=Carboxylicivirga mesophila TaxID=1166478 RepID=A0ABS5K9X2_9BACT|nr:PepSY-associated TM helix domain-containing protein [Carboxylicivirga mesophila]MBS2211805.1 PepSY-associated TM helix domain-containing protein [Carboxylicivirga mesophila]
MKWSNKAVRKWLRIIHRDLGYVMVGITIIYGISGYVLNHMDGKDPAYETIEGTLMLPAGLSKTQVETAWALQTDVPALKRILPIDTEHYRLMLDGGIGVYQSHNGEVVYEQHRKKPFIYFINKLHYNKVGGWTIMGDIFAFTLIFFAISGLFMVKGSKGLAGRGKYYLLLGLAIPIIYIFML